MADKERCLLSVTGDGYIPDSTGSDQKKRRARNKKLPDLKTEVKRTQARKLERRTAKEREQTPPVSVEQVNFYYFPMEYLFLPKKTPYLLENSVCEKRYCHRKYLKLTLIVTYLLTF